MKLRTGIFLLGLWAVGLPHAFAETVVDADIETDTHWTVAQSPYVVNDQSATPYTPHFLRVWSGATLTIDPGVVVKFGSANGLRVDGTVEAQGTSEDPIIFTSLADDEAGGDTNDDASATMPDDRQWMHLEFGTGSRGELDYTTIRYGGMSRIYVPFTGIENRGGTLTLDHTTLTHNGYDGLGQQSGHTTLSHSTITDQSVGINILGGSLEVDDSHIAHNSDVGIQYGMAAEVSVTESELDHNGWAIVAEQSPVHGSVSVARSSIHDNTVGGILNSTRIEVDDDGQIVLVDPGITISAHDTWWGSDSGPQTSDNQEGTGDAIQGAVDYRPWLTSDPLTAASSCGAGGCASNVLFLPGIEGSRLYEGTGCGKSEEEKLWDPLSDSVLGILLGAGDDKVTDLFLDSQGKSICDDIYAKEGDIIDAVHGQRIYQSFVEAMDALKASDVIKDWKAAAYDWRLSVDDVVGKGSEHDGKIFYEEATTTPYIEQTLRVLASSSKSGKVTIVAHSNGGLVAKALLTRLGSDAPTLVDRLILVASPQSGAPVDVGALLYGLDQAIPTGIWRVDVVHADVARALAQNSPMAYHLLPSEDYLESVAGDSDHPLIRFSGGGYATETQAYGSTIGNRIELDDFLLAKEGGRSKPRADDVESAEVANPALIDYAVDTHSALDVWAPPAGVEVDQIAGWGVDTVAGLDLYSPPGKSQRLYRPIFTEDGDGTVTVPSALMMASSTQVKRYWVDLHAFNKLNSTQRSHKDVFEIPDLQTLVNNIISGMPISDLPFVFQSQPTSTSEKRLTFFLHSPLTLQVTDTSGHTTGVAPDSSVSQDIPGSTYGQLGEVKYVTVPEGEIYQLSLHGQATGVFSLDLQESADGSVVTTSTVASVPTTANTLATLSIGDGLTTVSPLTVDEDGDGSHVFTLSFKADETATYEPQAPTVSPPPTRAPGSIGGSISIPVIATTSDLAVINQASTSVPDVHRTRPSLIKVVPNQQPNLTRAQGPKGQAATTTQGASAHTVPQQSRSRSWGAAVYNGLYEFWRIFNKIF